MRGQLQCATRSLFVIGTLMPALLLLASCKNDQPASRQQAGNRAVFGPPPDASPENPSPQARATPPRPSPDEPQERSRAQTPQASQRQSPVSSPAQEQQSSSRRQPSERAVLDGGERSIGLAREQQQLSSLRYQRPSSAVGDPGELSPLAKQPSTEVRSSVEPVRLLVRRWADTLLKGNLAQHMSLYAQTLDRFNGRSYVSREAVRSHKQRLLSQLAGVRQFEMPDIRLQRAADGSVIVSFRMEADTQTSALNGPYRLVWRHSGGAWKIHSEERLQSVSRTR